MYFYFVYPLENHESLYIPKLNYELMTINEKHCSDN